MNQKESVKLIVIIVFLGVAVYLLFIQKPESVVIQSKSTPTVSPKASTSPTLAPTPTPDVTANWQIYANADGGYEFKYPAAWNVVIHPNYVDGSLFGPGAALSGSDGGVEPIGILAAGQSLVDFVKKFNQSIESGATSETETVINGQTVVVSILPNSGEGAEIKNISFANKKAVYNVFLLYHTDFAKYPADKIMLDNFNNLLSTFRFVK